MTRTSERTQRLNPTRFHILLALSETDRHGSAIVRAVLEQTDGKLRLWPATLYGSLEVLLSEGCIEELDDARRPEGASERRRIYRITARGARALAEETERLAGLVEAARKHLAARKLGSV